MPSERKLKLDDTVDQKPLRPEELLFTKPESALLKLRAPLLKDCAPFCFNKSRLTILKQTRTRVKNINKNIRGLKTYIIRKKKKNSFVSVAWKKFKMNTGRRLPNECRVPWLLGSSQTKDKAKKAELVFFFSDFAFWSSNATKKDQKTTTRVLYKIKSIKKLSVKPIQPIKLIVPKRRPTEKK